MYSKSTYRPRRTRIYGANYDIGESYYKGALDNLDSKSKTIRFADTNTATNDSLFLNRPGRSSPENRYSESIAYGSKLGEEISSKHNLLKACSEEQLSKNLNHHFGGIKNELAPAISDADTYCFTPDLQFSSDKRARNGRVSVNDSTLRRKNCTFIQESSSSHIKKKNFLDEDNLKTSFNKLSKSAQLDGDFSETNASLRAKATKMRLANLESEMMELSEKQTEREQRNLSLKNLLSESDLSDSFSKKLALKNLEDKF